MQAGLKLEIEVSKRKKPTKSNVPMKPLGSFLKKQRIAAGFTQIEVAKELHLSSPQFVSNIERGVSGPPMKLLCTMIQLYRMKPDIIVKMMIDASRDHLKKNFPPR